MSEEKDGKAEEIVNSKHSKKVMETFKPEGETPYEKSATETWMKIFWVVAVGVLFYINVTYSGGAGFRPHLTTFIEGIIAIKGWQLIPAFMETAHEIGLVYEENEDEE